MIETTCNFSYIIACTFNNDLYSCLLNGRCEPFDTYPRTYDLVHASGLFSIEKKRYSC